MIFYSQLSFLVFLQVSKGIKKMESELTAYEMHIRQKREVLCSLINIYFKECMIQVWGNWNFQFNIESDVLIS